MTTGLHDWHRPMEDNPHADVCTASIPPKYAWTCSRCGETVYRPVSDGKPDDGGCPCASEMTVTAGYVALHDEIELFGRLYVAEDAAVVDGLKAKVSALEMELVQNRGVVKQVLNNQAQAKVAMERERDRLERIRRELATPPDEIMKKKINRLESEVESLRGKLNELKLDIKGLGERASRI